MVQALRVNGTERIERLEVPEALGGLIEPETREYPLAMVEWQDAWFDLDQHSVDDRSLCLWPNEHKPRKCY